MKSLEKTSFRELRRMFRLLVAEQNMNMLLKDGRYEDLDSKFRSLQANGVDDYWRFLEENEKIIDKGLFLTNQLALNINILENWSYYKGIVGAEKLFFERNAKEVASILKKEKRFDIFGERDGEQFEIGRVSSYDLIDNLEGTSRKAEKDERFEKLAEMGLLDKIANSLYLSDLSDCITNPKKLGEIMTIVTVKNALLNSGNMTKEEIESTDPEMLMEKSKELERNFQYKECFIKSLADQIRKFPENINYDNLLLCSAYRFKEYIDRATQHEEKTAYEVEELEYGYNVLASIQNEIGDRNIRLKAKIVDQETRKPKKIDYSTRTLRYDLRRLQYKIQPSNFTIDKKEGDQLLEGVEERKVELPLMERVESPEDILPEGDKDKKSEWRAKQKAYFVSPQEKVDMFTRGKKVKVSKGIEGKAYEGYAVFEYDDKDFAIIERIWERDKQGNKRYPYGNATVVAKLENLEEVLNNEKRLETFMEKQREVSESESTTYSGSKKQLESRERKREESPIMIRIYHGKNWQSRVQGILEGRIDPFKRNIKTSVKTKKKQPEQREEDAKKQGLSLSE